MIAFPVVWFIVNMFFCHIPSAASEPGTTTFCVRFNSPSTMLKSYSFNPLWAMNTTSFSGNIKPVPHFRTNNRTTFAKNLFPDVHFGEVSLIHTGLQRNAATLRNTSCVDWSEGFPNMVLRKINIYEHRTRVTRFNSL